MLIITELRSFGSWRMQKHNGFFFSTYSYIARSRGVRQRFTWFNLQKEDMTGIPLLKTYPNIIKSSGVPKRAPVDCRK
jgi:hypothetical protein